MLHNAQQDAALFILSGFGKCKESRQIFCRKACYTLHLCRVGSFAAYNGLFNAFQPLRALLRLLRLAQRLVRFCSRAVCTSFRIELWVW